MSFLMRVKSIPGNAKFLDVNHRRPGLVSHAVEVGEELGGAYLGARLNTQYGERAKWRGTEITYIAGMGGKIAAVLADLMGYGHGWTPHVNSVSMGLLAAHVAAIGANHGLRASGRSLPAATKVSGTMLGAIPPAPEPGKWLTEDEVDRLAQMRG